MKIYVGGAIDDTSIERVRQVQAHVARCGHKITFDWTTHKIDPHASETWRKQELAHMELAGVERADILIALYPDGRGLSMEIGYKMGKMLSNEQLPNGKPPIWVVDPKRPALFYSLHCIKVVDWDDLAKEIENLPDLER